MRRRPVPRHWRNDNHWLDAGGSSHIAAGGTCSCGRTFGTRADRHDMNWEDVIEAWKDHVEAAYYTESDPR